MIENSIILLIVATCAVYIGRRFLRQAKGSGPRCGGCSGGCGGSRKIFLLLLATALVPGRLALAAHPLITDDAGTNGGGNRQLELNGEYGRDKERSAGVLTEEGAGEIATSFSYGVSDAVDVVLGLPYQWARSEEDGVETGDEDGIGDTSLEVKWRFYENNGLSLAVKPGISLPSGNKDKGLGNGRATYGAVFITTQEIAPWAFHLNLGYVANDNKIGDRNEIWHASLAGALSMTAKLKAVANIGVQTNPDPASAKHPAFVLAGLIWAVFDNFDLDLGVKGGLNAVETDITGMAGMALRF